MRKLKTKKQNLRLITKNKRKESGITLIALVVTIVVLLILAGVSISMLTGENGIITQAIEAQEKTDIADEKERVELAVVAAAGKDGWGEITEDNLAEELTKNIGKRNEDYTLTKEGENFLVTYIDSNRSYLVDENGNVTYTGESENPGEGDGDGETIPDRSELKVGDYIDYVPDKNTTGYSTNKLTSTITGSTSNTSTITQDKQYARDGEGMTWQILRIYEDGSLDLIGSPTSQAIYLKGANGYNNGVTVMNDICKTLYSRGDIEARSVNYEDLDHWLTDAGKATRDRYSSSGGVTYGDTHKYTSSTYRYYPNLYAQEIGAGIDTENVKTTGLEINDEGNATGSTKANSSLKVTQTYWTGVMTSPNYGNGYNALKTSGSYWVASRYVNCESDMAVFGLWTVDNFLVGGIFMSYNHPMNINDYIRPVVTLSPSVQIENCTGDNSVDNMHKITKY